MNSQLQPAAGSNGQINASVLKFAFGRSVGRHEIVTNTYATFAGSYWDAEDGS